TVFRDFVDWRAANVSWRVDPAQIYFITRRLTSAARLFTVNTALSHLLSGCYWEVYEPTMKLKSLRESEIT
ncbi:MAG: hypothetical protein ACRCUY_02325, partial [Thermoguttaceae bacterium]